MAKLQDKFFNRVIEGKFVGEDGDEFPSQLPSPAGQGGKVLGVNAGGTAYELKDPSAVNEVLMENVVDTDGNSRFISGDIRISDEVALDKEYAKYTLSGNHLMIVCMFKPSENVTFLDTAFASMSLPAWVMNKIYGWGTTNRIAVNDATYGYNATNLARSSGTIRTYLIKSENSLVIVGETGTCETDKYYRFVFDLVIE